LIILITLNIIPTSGKIVNNKSYIQLVFKLDNPPTPVRNIAEFEPMEGVLIRYPFGISYEIISEMSEAVEVVTIVVSSSEQNYVYSQYQSHGVNVDHCSFLIAPSDTYWTRDYGPWYAFTGNDELAVIDFSFYGYGNYYPNDNNIPWTFANSLGFPHYQMPLYHEGGNYMTDGQGISASTDMLWGINPGKTHNEVREIVQDYLGIDVYHVVPDPNGAWLEHIDCWGKYLAPDKIMIREVPIGHPQYEEIEATATYFSNQLSCYGTPYKIARVYTPDNQPYTNSLILNNKVLVPITGSPWDDEAIESYEDALPGYEVLGFTGSWYSIDALHCRTKGIPDRGMLYIEHIPIFEDQFNHSFYEIESKITPYSGKALIEEKTGVYWKVEPYHWNFSEFEYVGDDKYIAHIPVQDNNSKFYYYIHAEDESGRIENHPYIGAPMAYYFNGIFINELPQNPSINGPSTLKNDEEGTFTISTQDPDGDDVFFYIEWGDGSIVDWDGPYKSNEYVPYQHQWSMDDTYNIKIKTKDIFGEESDWSNHEIKVTKAKFRLYHSVKSLQDFNNLYYQILKFIIQGFN